MAPDHTEDGASRTPTANSKQLKDDLVSNKVKRSGRTPLERQRRKATLTNTPASDGLALTARAGIQGGGDSTNEERDAGADGAGTFWDREVRYVFEQCGHFLALNPTVLPRAGRYPLPYGENGGKATEFVERRRIQFAVSALHDLKYIPEQPSADPALAKHLRDRLYIDTTHETGCAMLTSVGLLSTNNHVETATPIVYVRDYTGKGGWRHKAVTHENAKQNLLQMALCGGVAVLVPMLIYGVA